MRLHGFGPTVDLTTECGIRDGAAPDPDVMPRIQSHRGAPAVSTFLHAQRLP